jgi:hypothetical protein
MAIVTKKEKKNDFQRKPEFGMRFCNQTWYIVTFFVKPVIIALRTPGAKVTVTIKKHGFRTNTKAMNE